MKSKMRLIIIGVAILLFILILLFFGSIILKDNKNPYGDRCDDRDSYKLDDKLVKNIKSKFKEIDEFKDIDIYTKLCTVKIIVNLKNDVDLEIIKTKAREALEMFDEDELSFYDFALYVTSDNKDSEIYPINVSKHNSSSDFAW